MNKITKLSFFLSIVTLQFSGAQTNLNNVSDVLSITVAKDGQSARVFKTNGTIMLANFTTGNNSNYNNTVYQPKDAFWDEVSGSFAAICINNSSATDDIRIFETTWGNLSGNFNFSSYKPTNVCKGKLSNELYFTENLNNSIQKLDYSSAGNTPVNVMNGGPFGPLCVDNYGVFLAVNKNNTILCRDLQYGCLITAVNNLPGDVNSMVMIGSKVYYAINGDAASGGGLYTVRINNEGCGISASASSLVWNNMASVGGNIKSISKDDAGNLYMAFDGSTNKPIVKLNNTFLSADSFENTVGVNIFPNPVNDLLTIQLEGNRVVNQVAIYSMDGKKVQENLKTTTLDISLLKTGVYFLDVETQDYKKAIVKIVKK